MDFGPTNTSRMLLEMIEKDLATATAEYRNLMDKEVPGFNRAMGEHGLIPLSAHVPPVAGANGDVANPNDPDDDGGNLR
jgi:hypothetical protein